MRAQKRDRLGGRVPELVPCADTDDSDLRPEDVQLFGAHTPCASMVRDLENVHVIKSTGFPQLLEHAGLCVSRQKCLELPALGHDHDARVVGPLDVNALRRPQDRQTPAPNADRVALSQTPDSHAAVSVGTRRRFGVRFARRRPGDQQPAIWHGSLEPVESAGVIGVVVGQDHSVEASQPAPCERNSQR